MQEGNNIYRKDLRFRFISLDEAVSIIKQLDPVFDYSLFGVCIVDATNVGVSTVLGQDDITEYLYREKTNDFFKHEKETIVFGSISL